MSARLGQCLLREYEVAYPSSLYNCFNRVGTHRSHHFQSAASSECRFPDAVVIKVESCSKSVLGFNQTERRDGTDQIKGGNLPPFRRRPLLAPLRHVFGN